VPTLSETVMPGFEIGSWYAVMAPANTPAAIIRQLNTEIMKAIQDPTLVARMAEQGVEMLGSTPEEYGAYLRSELQRWTRVIQSAGIKAE
jgi:tripartite-type tricarboxylate transporter receptor subunit TctC